MPAPRSGSARRYGATLAKLAVTIGLYAIIFLRIDTVQLVERLSSARLSYVALGVVAYAGGQLTSAYRWHLLLAPVRLASSYWSIAAYYFIGMFFNFFLPTAVGGDAVKAVLLARETGSPARATVSVFMERNLGLLALLTIAVVAAFQAPPIQLLGLSLPTLAIGLALGFAGVNLLIFSSRAYRLIDRLASMTPLARVWPGTGAIHAALTPYLRTPRTVLAALALSFLFQIVVIGVVFLCTRALDLTVPLAALAVFVPLIALGGMLPVSINGLGVRDALYLLLFGRLGYPPDVALSLSLLYLAVTIVSSLPGGLIYLMQDRTARREARP
jgi:uncharacterized membrane protein YbhN (UPF0104 family)